MLSSPHCPYCLSVHIEEQSDYETKHNGNQKLYRCASCQRVFSETKNTFLERLKYPISFIIQVLNLRSEGLGFNAACRAFNISKNTLLNWEQRFAAVTVHSPCITGAGRGAKGRPARRSAMAARR